MHRRTGSYKKTLWTSLSHKKIFIFFCTLSFLAELTTTFADNIRFHFIQPGYVYHGSLAQNLKILKPHQSTHGKNWVYATPDLAIAASFLIGAGDFVFGIGLDDNKVFSITERYKGAFDLCKGLRGSIYKLSSDGFLSNQTDWDLEVVNPKEVLILDELPIIDAYEFLKQLEAEGRVKLYYYPDRPSWIPVDDSDIIRKAVLWTRGNFPTAGEELLQLHPNLKDRFETALQHPELSE